MTSTTFNDQLSSHCAHCGAHNGRGRCGCKAAREARGESAPLTQEERMELLNSIELDGV